MNKSKKDYEKKIKRKVVKFYIHEKQLYEFANTINFQKLCKDALRNAYRQARAEAHIEMLKRAENEDEETLYL